MTSLERPIFIWGTGRSGTHLLYDLLSLHPALICLTGRARSCKGLWGNLHWGESTPARLRGRRIPLEGRAHCWNAAGVAFDGIGLLTRDHLTPAMMAAVRHRYRRLTRGWGGPRRRILDKAGSYLLMADAIDAVFPDASHLFCLRDPRAVVNSWLRAIRFPEGPDRSPWAQDRLAGMGFWTVIPPGYEAHQAAPLVPRLTWQLHALLEIGFASRAFLQERLILFHYEQLLQDAHAAIRQLAEPLGLPWPERLWDGIPRAFPNYAPPWPHEGRPPQEPYGTRRCYTDAEVEQVLELEPLALELGYAPGCPGALREAPVEVARCA